MIPACTLLWCVFIFEVDVSDVLVVLVVFFVLASEVCGLLLKIGCVGEYTYNGY